MSDVLVFPDARACLFDLIDGTPHWSDQADRLQTVKAVYHLPVDAFTSEPETYPLALIYMQTGTQGYIDRVDRATIELYAPGEQAVQLLESISASIVGENIETPSGFLDSIRVITVPIDAAPYSDALNRAQMAVDITSRPL